MAREQMQVIMLQTKHRCKFVVGDFDGHSHGDKGRFYFTTTFLIGHHGSNTNCIINMLLNSQYANGAFVGTFYSCVWNFGYRSQWVWSTHVRVLIPWTICIGSLLALVVFAVRWDMIRRGREVHGYYSLRWNVAIVVVLFEYPL